jgi:hypothetical protein
LFTESLHGVISMHLAPFSGALSATLPLYCVLIFNSLFSVQFFVFSFVGCVWGSFCPGGYASLFQGWLGEYQVMLGAHLFGLPDVPSKFGASVCQRGNPPVFSV